MASQLPQVQIDQFADDLKMVSQQKRSRLLPTISPDNVIGVSAANFSFDFIGKSADMVENTDFYGNSIETNTPFYRHWGFTTPFEWGEMVAKQEVLRMGKDPKGKILKSAGMSCGRKIDDVIIKALNAPNDKVGPKEASASTVAFPASQILDVDLGSSDGLTPINLTIAKIDETLFKFNSNEVDPSLKKIMVVSSEELKFLKDGVDTRSSDYEKIDAIVTNTSKEDIQYMGFHWKILERLPVTTNVRTCFAYTEEALQFGEQGNTEVNTDKRSDKKFNWYAQIDKDMGAVRGEAIQVVHIPCATLAVDNAFG